MGSGSLVPSQRLEIPEIKLDFFEIVWEVSGFDGFGSFRDDSVDSGGTHAKIVHRVGDVERLLFSNAVDSGVAFEFSFGFPSFSGC